ncbi:MAG: shikimate dehydrogenase [SAR324 cluster bacterium]|nr:shikimate dehydrogenase [SAR324 cluster bacterium]
MPGSLNGNTRLYGIIGNPVQHTFSPAMHNGAFSALNLNAIYVAFPVLPELLESAVKGLKALNIAGINVTVPYKTAIIPFLDDITPLAQSIGAVNTVIHHSGCLTGTNTDGPGFVRSLQEISFDPAQKTIGILGAGGSARAILATLAKNGAKRLLLNNRTHARAEALVAEFQLLFPHIPLEAVSLEALYPQELDLLINTTSAGMKDPIAPVDLKRFSTIRNVADIIYNPPETKFLEQARQLGIPAMNGLGMLLFQGCEAFEFWTGQKAPEEVMKTELLKQISTK